MNALLVLYAGNITSHAVQPVVSGKSSLSLALQRARAFPGVGKTMILAGPSLPADCQAGDVVIENREEPWTVKAVLDAIAAGSAGFDFTYFAWADCPFLDPGIAGKLAKRHLDYAAEYSYADGWPYGLAPELLSPGTAAILSRLLGESDGGIAGRDALFSVIQKDINAFDIETEISSIDLRFHRLSLCADSKRNLLLLRHFAGFENGNGQIPDTAGVERIIAEKPEFLRTLPAFFPIQVYGGCPQSCQICLYPKTSGLPVIERKDFMETAKFEALLEKIVDFCSDAVIDISLWGEAALHPHKIDIISAVLRRRELSLVIETSGIGWENGELEKIADIAKDAPPRKAAFPPALSWIVSLDNCDPAKYREMRGAGFTEANETAKKLLSLFPKNTYVQAVRTTGSEEDTERFYRYWKEQLSAINAEAATNIIIQKYDDFCEMLPHMQASDLSPVQRKPCWHIMRDMPVLIDGTVLLCRQQICQKENTAIRLGNAFCEDLETIWDRGKQYYEKHAVSKYDPICVKCDEYYTYNF